MNIQSKYLIPLLLSIGVSASAAELSVADIVKEIDNRPSPTTSTMNLTMELIDKAGTTRMRKTRSFSKQADEKDMMVMYFDSPASVKGTAYLAHDYVDDARDDDSWLYLPAMRRTKRVTGGGEADSFMGSDFSYADIDGIELGDWEYTMAESSVDVDGFDCWVLDAIPRADRHAQVVAETGYSKRRVWVRKDNFYVVRAELTLEKNKRTKYLKVEGLYQLDTFWVAKQIRMVTTKGGEVLHESRMHFSDVKLNSPLDDALFMEAQLGKNL